jgi:uncharacterized protein (DUF1697 family)
MPVLIAMLRGVNLGPHNRIKMDALRALCESLKLEDPRTYVQSGNVIFRTKESNLVLLSKKIQSAIERKFGFRSEVILRSTAELRKVTATNPFAKRDGIEPGKLLVTFLASEPSPEARAKLLTLKPDPEELHHIGREIYIYFPDGAGRSKLQWSSFGRMLKTPGTARNWNSVIRMLEIAEQLEAE